MTSRLCRVCRGWHELSDPWPYECRTHFPPPPHRTINIIGDNLDHVMNMADGKRYSSKSEYYRAVRRSGCEIVGNEQPKTPATRQLDDPINDIKFAIEKTKSASPRRRRAHG